MLRKFAKGKFNELCLIYFQPSTFNFQQFAKGKFNELCLIFLGLLLKLLNYL